MPYGMIDGEDDFLEMLFVDPDDETARQVYADWLEDQGDLRAEWMRWEAVAFSNPGRSGQSARDELRRLLPELDRTWCWFVTRDRLWLA